jgi:hypothetical protein
MEEPLPLLLTEDFSDFETGETPSQRKFFRETFRMRWLTLSEIGKHFNFSAIKTGKILVEMKLRKANGTPTDFAWINGFCWQVEESRYSGNPYYLWNAEKTINAITDYIDPPLI